MKMSQEIEAANRKLMVELKEKLEQVLKHRFYGPTAYIYPNVQGLYDLRTCAANIESNILKTWEAFFIIKERMCRAVSTMITPEDVFKASGHVERFNDFMVKDVVTGEFYRADHVIKKHFETLLSGDVPDRSNVENLLQQLDNFKEKEMDELIQRFSIMSQNNNALSEAKPFNLMFEVSIGPSGKSKGYLRPETAQGIFTNFNHFLLEKQGKLPFAVAQIGSSFRNEIAPRQGLLRVREFKMAEIEHFLDPQDKSHKKFSTVAHLNFNMFTSAAQMSGGHYELLNLGVAVANRTIANETLGYFIGRIYLFLRKIGIHHDKLRFRQHMPNEMAHYACDCWDAECLTSYGWVECVGCADRSAYDLERHSMFSRTKLVAKRQLETPKTFMKTFLKPNMSVIGKTFKGNAKILSEYLNSMSDDDSIEFADDINSIGRKSVTVKGIQFDIDVSMFEHKEMQVTVNVEEYVPNVIEPSFGIGRLLYCVLEHNFMERETDKERTLFTLPPVIAPLQFVIMPLSSNSEFKPLVEEIGSILDSRNIMFDEDASSASIGKRYARKDEIGVPFGITVDFDSVRQQPPSVTIRERDSMKQIRVPMEELGDLAIGLAVESITWKEAMMIFPEFLGQTN